MATRITTTARDLYREDPYLRAQAQAAPLRDQRFAELDLANLIEEVEDLAGAPRRPQPGGHDRAAPAQVAALAGDRPAPRLA